MSDVSFLPDPCALPEQQKKRCLNEKEKLVYAPFSGVGGVLYDKDAVYVDLGGSHGFQESVREVTGSYVVTFYLLKLFIFSHIYDKGHSAYCKCSKYLNCTKQKVKVTSSILSCCRDTQGIPCPQCELWKQFGACTSHFSSYKINMFSSSLWSFSFFFCFSLNIYIFI